MYPINIKNKSIDPHISDVIFKRVKSVYNKENEELMTVEILSENIIGDIHIFSVKIERMVRWSPKSNPSTEKDTFELKFKKELLRDMKINYLFNEN
jgi:hypothetical protein